MKPIVLYTHSLGPNPWKSAIVLEELGLPYQNRFIEAIDVKKRPYLDLNPNRRVPCIEDPNTGIADWFVFRHSEHLPSAITRYRQEIRRVIGVLDAALSDKEYLVGNRCTIADLGFVPWDEMVADICEGEAFLSTLEQDCPQWSARRRRLLARPAVQRALQAKANALARAGPAIIPTNWEHEINASRVHVT